jgi:hypothetical protein
MSDDGGQRPDPPSAEEQFTVPIPSTPAPQSVSSAVTPPYPAPASPPVAMPPPGRDVQQTQALPVSEPTRELPPPPWAGGPVPVPAAAPMPEPMSTAAPVRPVDGPPDPLLAQIGAVLFWITVGWWVTVLVRLLGTLVREGPISTLFLESLGRWPEETIVAAVISVLAALVLLLGRGSRGRDLLGWASGALALVTVAVAIWRVLP